MQNTKNRTPGAFCPVLPSVSHHQQPPEWFFIPLSFFSLLCTEVLSVFGETERSVRLRLSGPIYLCSSGRMTDGGSAWTHPCPSVLFLMILLHRIKKARVRGEMSLSLLFVYYESIKREPKIRGIYECRCDERLQTKTKKFTRLPYTGLVLELEHLKILKFIMNR